MLEILSAYFLQLVYRWLSLDVASLFTSIEHEYDLRAVQYCLEDHHFYNTQTKFFYDHIEFTLMHNNVAFYGEALKTSEGAAMGVRFAPRYANFVYGVLGEPVHLQKQAIWSKPCTLQKIH